MSLIDPNPNAKPISRFMESRFSFLEHIFNSLSGSKHTQNTAENKGKISKNNKNINRISMKTNILHPSNSGTYQTKAKLH